MEFKLRYSALAYCLSYFTIKNDARLNYLEQNQKSPFGEVHKLAQF